MTQPSARDTHKSREADHSRRDWMWLPLLSLATIVLLGGGTEWASRRLFAESKVGMHNCVIFDDASTGARGIPNSVCMEKAPETPWVEYRFNSCGHRAGMECGPKPPNTYRIVMIGSSFAMGERVQIERTFAALLPAELTRVAGRKVELYNESMGWGFTHSVSLRFDAALAAGPDLILWILTPGDVARAPVVLPTDDLDPWRSLGLWDKAWHRLKAAISAQSLGPAISDVFGRTRTAFALRHFLYKYQSRSRYLAQYLRSGDDITGIMKAQPSGYWKKLLLQVDTDAAAMEERAHTAGVLFAAVLVPDKPLAVMTSMGMWPEGYDPFKLDDELRTIILSHGGIYLDILSAFRTMSNPERYYFPVDGHPNDDGQALFSILLAKQLTGGDVPALTSTQRARSSLEQGR